MGKARNSSAFRNMQMVFTVGTVTGRSDGELLEQVRSADRPNCDAAFTALIERHGPMVLRTCRSILHNDHAAEDAFQATFLVLLRRAPSLWVRESLGPWLHQVASRVSAKARTAAAKRDHHEHRAAKQAGAAQLNPCWNDFAPVIHQELDRLPQRYREPILLCCVEELSREQAAARLGWPMGTLQSRLARGRERLKSQLIKRGIAPGAAIAGTILFEEGCRAAVPSILIEATIQAVGRAALASTANISAISATAAQLIKGAIMFMVRHNLKVFAGVLLTVALVSTGVGVWAEQKSALGQTRDDIIGVQISNRAIAPKATNRESDPRAEDPARAGLTDGGADFELEEYVGEPPADEIVASLKYNDGRPDGKKSLGGPGEMIEFSAPSETNHVSGLRVHGARYGNAQAPRESFLIYFLSPDQNRVLHTEMAPYSLFERGDEQWVDINFERPLQLPKTFWVVLDFRAHATKGVFVSYDTSSGGKYSRSGLPGISSTPVRFGGDWMVEVVMGK
jgi:RNA polymerase sigma factor (sigma-70 family)